MSTVKTYSVDSGDATNLTLKTNGTTALTVDGTTQAVTISGSQTVGSNLTFTGTGNRITGDFSNGTVANRVSFQTSTTNSATVIQVIPNGTSVLSALQLYSNTTGLNASFFNLIQDNTGTYFYADKTGTGTYLPMVFNAGGNERMRIVGGTGSDVGYVGIGTASPSSVLHAYRAGSTEVAFKATNGTSNWLFGNLSTGMGMVYGPEAQPFGIWTNNTERMRIDSSGNVGIGTASPGVKLDVNGALRVGLASNPTTIASNSQFYDQSGVGPTISGYNFTVRTGNPTPSETFRVDSAGNVGIGTISPGTKLDIVSSINTGLRVSDGTTTGIFFPSGESTNSLVVGTTTNYPLVFYTNNSARARIDTSGNLLVGTTTASGKFTVQCGNTLSAIVTGNTSGTAGYNGALFYNNGLSSLVGQITISGSTASYLSVSDYRLKNTVVPMTGALNKVALLKPVTYKWKTDGSNGQGFIAHELQEVVPECVSGEKDAVDEDGNPKYQGIDTSFLVATLTAAIQEQQAIIEQLKADVAALKGKV
jgi:hypothetical protein